MDLASLVDPSRVVFGARANNKEQLLLDLASRAAASLNLDPKPIFNALWAREELGSTGLGEGFALPHARIEGLDRFFGMFARLKRPVHFDSVDAKPVDLVFLLLNSGDRPGRAPRRARRRLETPARQGIRRKIARSVKRCRLVRPALRSPTFVIFK